MSDSGSSNESQTPDVLQVLAVYQTDLLGEVEGLLRSLTKMQAQVERLRSGGDGGNPLNPLQQREAIKMLAGNLKTFMAKVDTLRETLPEIGRAITALENRLPPAETDTQSTD